jgi:acyl carrier protein
MTGGEDVHARIKRVLVDCLMLHVDPQSIADDQRLFGDGLGLDSVDALELLLGLEAEFGIRVKSDRIKRDAFTCVNTLAAFVERHRTAAASEGTGPAR